MSVQLEHRTTLSECYQIWKKGPFDRDEKRETGIHRAWAQPEDNSGHRDYRDYREEQGNLQEVDNWDMWRGTRTSGRTDSGEASTGPCRQQPAPLLVVFLEQQGILV